jgi:uncharacterized lipoprotein YajG
MRHVILLAAAALISGCASMGESQRAIDYDKIARVEAAAKTVGVSVYWLNYPTKAASALN